MASTTTMTTEVIVEQQRPGVKEKAARPAVHATEGGVGRGCLLLARDVLESSSRRMHCERDARAETHRAVVQWRTLEQL